LSSDTRVFCGLHDSNAALLAARSFPAFAGQDSTVVSTGTWFLVMRSPASSATAPYSTLAEGRDCLINVDADGKPVPSARFMGGREIELLTGAEERLDCAADQARLVAAAIRDVQSGARILPTLAAGVGPYPHARHRWEGEPTDRAERRAATGLYAALVTDKSLDLVGARDHILIEGRFAEAQVFVRALASLRKDAAVYVSDMHDGVSYGALRLVDPGLSLPVTLRRVEPLPIPIEAYKSAWRNEAERLEYAA
jgi:sugar (pentulose or hexulose) kinase